MRLRGPWPGSEGACKTSVPPYIDYHGKKESNIFLRQSEIDMFNLLLTDGYIVWH